MAKKKPKGPPKEFLQSMGERRQVRHQGRTPTPEHAKSIWDTSYIPDRYAPAISQVIADAEKRLGIRIPEIMREQLLIQNGGCLSRPDFSAVASGDVYVDLKTGRRDTMTRKGRWRR